MENIFDSYTSDMVFTNEGIKISIPLTGKVMPIEFKNVILDDMSIMLSTQITDDIFTNGYTEINKPIVLNKIELVMTIKPDGTFENKFELVHHHKPHSSIKHSFLTCSIPLPYLSLYRKKALRTLKRMCLKALNNKDNFRMSKYD